MACGGLCVAAGRGLIESGSWAVGLAVVLKGVAVLLVGCFVRWVVWDRSRVLKAQEVVILGTALVPPTTLEAIRDDTTLTPFQRELLRRK